LLPLAWGIVASPDGSGAAQASFSLHAAPARDGAPASAATPPPSAWTILALPLFWCAALGSGVLHAVGIIASSHLVAFGIERGIAAEQAASLISVMGVASIVGAFGSGLLCARIGGGRALVLIAAGTAAGWMMLSATHALASMAAVTLLIGAGGSAVFPAMSVLVGEKFGANAVPRVLGLFGLATLPLNFGLPPLAGVLHDRAGGYEPVVLTIVGCCAGVALLYASISRWPARPLASAA
jgi:cyanate permease